MVKKQWQALAADLLFPEGNACHLCGRWLERPGILCAPCADALETLRYKKLRIPSAQPHPSLLVCLAAWPHRGIARDLVHLLKYESDCACARLLGEGMAAALALSPLQPPGIDTVVPVPLHEQRLRQRGYNQALLLAQAVCAHTRLPLEDGALVRLCATETQTHREREERLKAMQHAFAAADAGAVRGKRFLLVDDVLTTGATAMSCARALLDAGAEGVSLLTACRA